MDELEETGPQPLRELAELQQLRQQVAVLERQATEAAARVVNE